MQREDRHRLLMLETKLSESAYSHCFNLPLSNPLITKWFTLEWPGEPNFIAGSLHMMAYYAFGFDDDASDTNLHILHMSSKEILDKLL